MDTAPSQSPFANFDVDTLGMSVLDRVKMFLPQLEKANSELDAKIKAEGAASGLIDANLGKDDAMTEEEEAAAQEEGKSIVNLEFAMGDFEKAGKVLEGVIEDAGGSEMEEGDDAAANEDIAGSTTASGPSEVVLTSRKPPSDLFSAVSTTRKSKVEDA